MQKPLEDKKGSTGKPLKLEAKVIAKPQPHFTWTKDGKLVPETPRIKQETTSDVNMHVATLEIPEPKKADSGLYKLNAKNTEGEATSKANVTIG